MPRFKWHAHYFDGIDGKASCVRKTIIEADYGDEAEKIAKAQWGSAIASRSSASLRQRRRG
jgi:hypothetical protein